MQVHSINSVYTKHSNNYQVKSVNFRSLHDFGRQVLRANGTSLEELAIRYRKLPEDTLTDLLKVRNSFGFVKTNESMSASGKFKAAIAKIECEITELKGKNTADAQKRLAYIENEGNNGLSEAFNPDAYDSEVDKGIRDTYDRGI